MAEPPDFVHQLVEDTLDGYEDVLGPSALGQLRALLGDSLATHDQLSALVAEHAPREAPNHSDEVPTGDALEAELARGAKKDHG